MKIKRTPLRFFDYVVACLLLFVFTFIPLAPSAQKNTKPETSTLLYIPRQIKDVPAPKVSASAVYIYDPDSDTVLYEKNSKERFYPASTTKLMTALTALDVYDPDQILTVNSGGAIGNTIHLTKGSRLTVESLLNGLLINSGNDAALALAENYPEGYNGFVEKMNQKSAVLGLTNTHFSNPSGLINPNHYTTAKDLNRIAQDAVSNAIIRKIVELKEAVITDISGKNKYHLYSTNQLLGLEGVRGLKTGWAPESKEVLVSFVERDSHAIIVTVLYSDDRFSESKRLIDWVYNNFSWQQI